MGGKLVIGFIIDKFGAGLAAALFALLTCLGMITWLVFPTTPLILYVGACLVGFASPIMTVGMPMTIRQTFGDRTYPRIYSYVVTMQMVVGGIASPLIAIILGAFGGQYSAVYIFGGCVTGSMVILFTIINTFRGKYPQVDEDGNPMPSQTAVAAE
jgi:MFS family permease